MASRTGVKLSTKLPKGTANGLVAVAADLVREPYEIRCAVVLFDCLKTERDHDLGVEIPVARIRRFEPIDGKDHSTLLRQMLMAAWNARTDEGALPMELQVDVDAALGDRTTLREADR